MFKNTAYCILRFLTIYWGLHVHKWCSFIRFWKNLIQNRKHDNSELTVLNIILIFFTCTHNFMAFLWILIQIFFLTGSGFCCVWIWIRTQKKGLILIRRKKGPGSETLAKIIDLTCCVLKFCKWSSKISSVVLSALPRFWRIWKKRKMSKNINYSGALQSRVLYGWLWVALGGSG